MVCGGMYTKQHSYEAELAARSAHTAQQQHRRLSDATAACSAVSPTICFVRPSPDARFFFLVDILGEDVAA